MNSFKWTKVKPDKKYKYPLKIVNIMMKELLHPHYNLNNIKKPCFLVFRHIETDNYCHVGEVKSNDTILNDVVKCCQEKSIVRTFSDWNTIILKYIHKEQLSNIEQKCAKHILQMEIQENDDIEWKQLKKYWNSLY